jgi:G6PDH family F420-dependent oxidoreductase
MTIKLGYALSSEENGPRGLVDQAMRVEKAGLDFLMISDHYHPWITAQGHSPFVWSVLGGIATMTDRIRIGTGVTCPTMRIHPAIIAQAAATVAVMFEGRFMLGVGSGEALNEQVTGTQWPTAGVRVDMLEEALEIIRELWTGDEVTFHGDFYDVERARVFDVPEMAPPINVAAAAASSARLAARQDGLITTTPDKDVLSAFAEAGGQGKPRYGQITVSWASDEATARKNAHKSWPNTAFGWDVSSEVPTPSIFDSLATLVREEDVASQIVCFTEPGPCIEAIKKYEKAGFDHIYLHQVGHKQAEFIDYIQTDLAPALR